MAGGMIMSDYYLLIGVICLVLVIILGAIKVKNKVKVKGKINEEPEINKTDIKDKYTFSSVFPNEKTMEEVYRHLGNKKEKE